MNSLEHELRGSGPFSVCCHAAVMWPLARIRFFADLELRAVALDLFHESAAVSHGQHGFGWAVAAAQCLALCALGPRPLAFCVALCAWHGLLPWQSALRAQLLGLCGRDCVALCCVLLFLKLQWLCDMSKCLMLVLPSPLLLWSLLPLLFSIRFIMINR